MTLNPALPALPDGTQIALVRQMLLIDDAGPDRPVEGDGKHSAARVSGKAGLLRIQNEPAGAVCVEGRRAPGRRTRRRRVPHVFGEGGRSVRVRGSAWDRCGPAACSGSAPPVTPSSNPESDPFKQRPRVAPAERDRSIPATSAGPAGSPSRRSARTAQESPLRMGAAAGTVAGSLGPLASLAVDHAIVLACAQPVRRCPC